MTTTFSLLDASRALGDAASSSCSTAILLLTDGEITEGLGVEDPSEIASLVESLNAEIGAEIFTFALGPDADGVSETLSSLRAPDIPPATATGAGHVFQSRDVVGVSFTPPCFDRATGKHYLRDRLPLKA